MNKKRSVEASYPLKRFKEIPIYVVEDHNDVLPFVYRCIGSKHLPLLSNTILHFDSHPDMLIPRGLKSDVILNKHALFESLSIENWILPAAFAGHISNVMWIKPPWANQLSDGNHSFKIGQEVENSEIKVTSLESYFLSDCLYSPEEQLTDVKNVNFEVSTLGTYSDQLTAEEELKRADTAVQKFVGNGDPFILDIDLDFFSTRNPFNHIYKNANMYEKLKKIYYFSITDKADPKVLKEALDTRNLVLKQLASAWSYIGKHGNLKGFEECNLIPVYEIENLAKEVQKCYNDIDWELIHDAGCTCDDTELPEHVSTHEEISGMIQKCLSGFINQLPSPPTIVTVSRSSEDDYCPPEDVDWIENEVLQVLKSKFTTNNVILHYQD